MSREFSNELNFTPALKNRDIMALKWRISYYENPQILTIDTGLSANVLNHGVLYADVSQYAKIPTFLNNISIAYRVLNAGIIKQHYQVGIINEHQKLHIGG